MMGGRGRIKVVEILEATTGGTRRHLYDLVTRLDRSKFDVSVICSSLRDPDFAADVSRMKKLGVDIIDVKMQRRISPFRDAVALMQIRRHLLSYTPDVVHTHSSKAGVLGRLAAKWTGVGCVVHSPHVFPFEMDVSAGTRAFYLRLEHLAARFMDLMICVSSAEKKTAMDAGLVSEDHCFVVVNGVKPQDDRRCSARRAEKRAELGLMEDDVVIGTIGRFTRQKGHDYLIEAVRELSGSLPKARFAMVGNGELYAEIEEKIKEAGIANRCLAVRVSGDVSEYYPIFDVFTLTSRWEGTPYALLEAMSHGVPVVAFRVGGVPDIVRDGTDGLLVPAGNVAALADAISGLASDSVKRDDLGNSAKQRVAAEFSVQNMVAGIEQVYVGGAAK